MKILALFLLISGNTVVLFAQDGNYWHSPYGKGGFFLPGAVIANNGDSGVYFANPALFAQSSKSSISVNAVLYQLQSIKLKNGAGTGKDLDSKSTTTVPQMVSGRFHIWKKKFPFAYAVIHNPQISFNANQRRDENFQVLNDAYSPGTEYFLGQYVEQNVATETQMQLSTGKKLAAGFFGGITLEANLYHKFYSTNFSGRALVNPGIVDFSIVSNNTYYSADFKNYGVRIKAGLAYTYGKHNFGLVISTPVIHIKGSGSIESDVAVENLKLDPSLDPIAFLANARQTGLKVKWKVPFSIASGYLYQYSKGQLYFATEYFGRVKEYDILAPENAGFIRPDTGNINSFTYSLLHLKDARRAVINVAFGSSFYFTRALAGFLSLRTNFTYFKNNLFKDDSGFTPYTCTWNNYNIQFGINTKRKQMNLKAGLFLALGINGKYNQQANFDDPDESNALQGTLKTVDAKYFSAGLMISYIHNL